MGDQASLGHRSAVRWGWLGAGAPLASAIGYALQHELAYVSKPTWVGEIEFYGIFASLAFMALLVGAGAAWPARGERGASPWAWGALAAALISALGYVVQTIFDHVPVSPVLARDEFYGGVTGGGLRSLIAGGGDT